MKRILLLILALHLSAAYAMESDSDSDTLDKSMKALSVRTEKKASSSKAQKTKSAFSTKNKIIDDTPESEETPGKGKNKAPISDDEQEDEPEIMPLPACAFSPDIKGLLIHFINAEQESIRGAVYRFTLYDIAKMLCAKQNANPEVPVQLCVNQDFKQDFCAALRLMVKKGIPISCNESENQYETMHHKFLIFSKNQKDKKLLWTGSFNFTGNAHKNNWENVMVTSSPKAIKEFEEQFAYLKKNSRQLSVQELVCSANKSQFARAMNCIPNGEQN